MNYRKLGNTNINVSTICLGTMTWDEQNSQKEGFAQMSIKFCEIQPFIGSVIVGATTMEQLKINIESVNVNLSDENITEINKTQKLYPNPCP